MPSHTPDPSELAWIDMAFRDLHNKVTGMYLGDPANFRSIQEMVSTLHTTLENYEPVAALRCPAGLQPCGPMGQYCCWVPITPGEEESK